MNNEIAKKLLSIDFDGTWETLIPMLSELLDSAESWLERENEYHTTQVLTILMAFRSIASAFECNPLENDLLLRRYEKVVSRLLEWFETRSASRSSGTAGQDVYTNLAKSFPNWRD